MRTSVLFLCLAMAGTGGCYRQSTAAPTMGRQEVRYEEALASAHRASRGTWTVKAPGGKLVIQALGQGGVRVTRGAQWESRQPVRGISNAWITGKVKSKLAVDPEVSAMAIDVDTDGAGVVTMTGHVGSARVAGRAIVDAIDVSGVNAVHSYLAF